MKSARFSRSAAEPSASSRRPAMPGFGFQFKMVVRAALLIAVAGASVAAMARHHGWLASLGMGDSAAQVAPAMDQDRLPESTSAGTFTPINVSAAGKSAMEGTFAIAINTAGDVTGVYSNSPGTLHGFVRDRLGITAFDGSKAGSGAFEGTIPISINTAGEIAGTIIDSNNVSYGFVRSISGPPKEFEALSAGTAANRGTVAWRINDAGEVVGFFSTGSLSTPSTYHGFLRKANGTFTQIDDPKAGSGVNPANGKKQGTQAYSINNAGEIIGSYVDASNERHGFFYNNGAYTEFDPPGAGTSIAGHKEGMNGTIPTGIDADGVITGTFTDTAGLRHGFVRNTDGSFEVFNGPSAAAGPGLIQGTFPFNIGSSTGVVVGFDADANGFYHAFERSEAGTVIEIKPPGAVASTLTPLPGAGAGGVNEYGDVAGGYSDASGVYHGFIYTPVSTPTVATPTFLSTPKKGPYVGPVKVEIEDATAGATISYTLDKTTPPTSKTSKEYTGAITISKTTTIKAIAEKSGYTNSSVATATYTILKAQTISWPKMDSSYPVGKKLTLSATASSGLSVSYVSSTSKVCTVSKTVSKTATTWAASLLKAGSCTIVASQAGNPVYAAAKPAPKTFTVTASQ
jgi:hypothetical protein